MKVGSSPEAATHPAPSETGPGCPHQVAKWPCLQDQPPSPRAVGGMHLEMGLAGSPRAGLGSEGLVTLPQASRKGQREASLVCLLFYGGTRYGISHTDSLGNFMPRDHLLLRG